MINQTFKIFVLLVFTFFAAHAQDPQKAKTTSYGRGYLEYIPEGYSTSTELYPCIIFLHGSGERGTGTPTELAKVTVHGPPKLIKGGNKMCFTVNGKTECFIVLSPQTMTWGWSGEVTPFVQYALRTYRIDPNRIYLTGLSMGGLGTWVGASEATNNPNYFAALAPMAAKGSVPNGTAVASKKIPVWAFHGSGDTSIPLANGTKPITGMINANAVPAPIFTIYAGANHGETWTRGYSPDHTYHNPNVYEWFLAQRNGEQVNAPPIVDAGADLNITLPVATTTIAASANDTDGAIVSYEWSKVSGPAATLSNTTANTLSISNAVSGIYEFKITVTDNGNLKATDDVKLIVSAPADNQPPTVEAGNKKTITLPVNSASFTAIATDTDGTITTYAWQKIGGGSLTLIGASTATLSVSNATNPGGTYVFRVQVTDNKGATSADTVRLKVNATTSTTTSAVGRVASVLSEEVQLSKYELALDQNYPNPFTESTIIPFTLDEENQVVIKVYSATGKEVTTLINEVFSAGPHQVELKASLLKLENGEKGGVYYYKLYSKENIITKRLIFAQ